MQQPSTITTTEMWQWQCGTCRAGWKMLREVTTSTCCPHGHGGRCIQGQGTPPPPSPSSAGNPAPHCHHHNLQEQVQGITSSRALAAGADEGSNTDDAGRHTTTTTTLNPAGRPVDAELCWVPDPYLMVQQLREFESLNDELVALRVQLQEYAEEIHRSSKDDDCINAGTGMKNMNWLLALPPNVRDVVILARDVIESFIAISTTSAPPAN